jgi:hypothetical protein
MTSNGAHRGVRFWGVAPASLVFGQTGETDVARFQMNEEQDVVALSQRTDDYCNWVEAFARNHKIPMEWAEKGLRKEDHVLPALRRLEERGAYGVYFIFKSMEQGRSTCNRSKTLKNRPRLANLLLIVSSGGRLGFARFPQPQPPTAVENIAAVRSAFALASAHRLWIRVRGSGEHALAQIVAETRRID